MGSSDIPQVVTYCHDKKFVYVKLAENYEQALDIAQQEFADELRNVRRDRISFSLRVKYTGEKSTCSVRIPATTWPAAFKKRPLYAVLDVHVQPELHAERVDGPPGYEIAVGKEGSESKGSKSTSNTHPAGNGVFRSFFGQK